MPTVDRSADRTARQAFEHLMRDLIARALHELGCTGKGPRRSGALGRSAPDEVAQ